MAKVSFDGTNKVITVLPGINEIDVSNDLYSEWKRWMATGDNAKYPEAMRTVGGDPTNLAETQFAPQYFFLKNGWYIFVDNGEVVNFQTNLYTDNPDGVIYQTANDSGVNARLSDAVLVKNEFEQALSYGEYVVFDTDDGVAGTEYPTGTHGQPVNNLADALSLMNRYGVHKMHLHSSITIDQDIPGVLFEGISGKEVVTLLNVDINNTYFYNVYIVGSANGTGQWRAKDCALVGGLQGVSGAFDNCGIIGDITIADLGQPTLFTDCFALGFDGTVPIVSLGVGGDNTPHNVNFRGFNGKIELANVDLPTEKVTFSGGPASALVISSSCTDGVITAGGMLDENVIDNSNGTAVTVKTSPTHQSITELKAILDQIQFVNGDVVATLDGELVTTDDESRKKSKADISPLL